MKLSSYFNINQETEHAVFIEHLYNNRSNEIYFKSTSLSLHVTPEVLISIGLLPAMKYGIDLSVSGNADSAFVNNLDTIQNIYTAWHSFLNKVNIKGVAEVSTKENQTTLNVGTFFSGGLDSFYTLLKNKSEITHVIFIYHFDRIRENELLLQEKIKTVKEVALKFGKNAVIIETNLREFLEPEFEWGTQGHAIMLYTVSQLLSKNLKKIYIPASHTYKDLLLKVPHPMVDPLWGGDRLHIIHDGCEFNRYQKAEYISNSDIAMERLRVCFINTGGAYNCGKCEKCLRTMLNLEAAGVLEKCTAFDNDLSTKNIRNININSAGKRSFIIENLKIFEEKSRRPDIQKALRNVLKKSKRSGIRGLFNQTRRTFINSVKTLKGKLKQTLQKYPTLFRKIKAVVSLMRH